jgi:hypothetical protein
MGERIPVVGGYPTTGFRVPAFHRDSNPPDRRQFGPSTGA